MQKISKNAFPYPMPMAVLSCLVEGKVNHMALAWLTRTNANPPMLGVTVNKKHLSHRGIREHGVFGVSLPSIDQLAAVDHIGLVSGLNEDKSKLFDVFFGELAHAPMIRTFPVTMACRVTHVVELPTHDFFIGDIVEAFCDERCLSDGKPDIEKIRPFSLTMPDNRYWTAGAPCGDAWASGAAFRQG
jgi:flavin reductase (DIM6/NTAB) family NADH-FMN oxidoreductase RutF